MFGDEDDQWVILDGGLVGNGMNSTNVDRFH